MQGNKDEIAQLCLNCERPDCPGNGCDEYRELKALKVGTASKHRHYASTAAELRKPTAVSADTLIRVNNAITALEELLHDPSADQFLAGSGNAQKLLTTLKHMRFEKCIDAIDWKHVANKLSKEQQKG